jgi:HK97 family phage major capsid protein/HK97 family phage prohead protease
MKTYNKTGYQSADDPMKFILSTDSTDRHGDIVEQSWILKFFKKNPVALIMHNHNSLPIGTWKNVSVRGGQLMGTLEMAKAGTSELIDTIRSLLEQNMLKAVSVGFKPNGVKAIDEEKPWRGSRLSDNELLEASLVSVGANQDALMQAMKGMACKNLGEDTLAFLKAIELDSENGVERSKTKPKSQDSDDKGSLKKRQTKGDKPMSLSERIKKLQAEVSASREELDTIETKAADEERELSDEEISQMDVLADDIEKSSDQLTKLERIEKSKMNRVADTVKAMGDNTDTDENNNTQGVKVDKAFGEGVRASSPNKKKGHRALATIASVIRGHVEQRNPIDVAKAHYNDEPEIALLAKAVSAPAAAGTAGWAEELVRDTWGEFLELLRDTSIYAQLPGMRLDFDGFGKITLPRQQGRGQLAGAFVAEGAPIPVKQGTVDSTDMTPKGLKVISSFTREIALRSNPSIENMISSQILEDTAESLDAHYMGALARDTVNPGGIQDAAETGAGNINAAAGATAANIQSDTKAMIAALVNNRFTSAVWVMNPIRILSLMDIQDAASGVFLYKAELAAGTFRGFPYISSGNVPADIVLLQATNAVAYGSEYGPVMDASNSASLHYEDSAPLPLVDNPAIPIDPALNEIAAPVRSLFQTDSIALRMTMGLDHRQVRANGRQVLTGVAW